MRCKLPSLSPATPGDVARLMRGHNNLLLALTQHFDRVSRDNLAMVKPGTDLAPWKATTDSPPTSTGWTTIDLSKDGCPTDARGVWLRWSYVVGASNTTLQWRVSASGTAATVVLASATHRGTAEFPAYFFPGLYSIQLNLNNQPLTTSELLIAGWIY